MDMTVAAVTPGFVAEIDGVDLAQALNAATVAAIKAAFAEYAVLVFPAQSLDEQQQLAFARHFGPIEHNLLTFNRDAKFRVTPELIDISNLTVDDTLWDEDSRMRQFYVGNQLWHTDSSFKHVPALASALYAREVPPVGGNTEFADLRAAYDALDPGLQSRLEGMVAEHALATSRARTGFAQFTAAERDGLPPVPQVLVRTISESGRRSLYLAAHAGSVRGLPADAGRALIDRLIDHATQPPFVYAHRWRVGDLVLWDNRCTMHRGRPFDDRRYRRDLLRATVSDVANTCEQVAATTPYRVSN